MTGFNLEFEGNVDFKKILDEQMKTPVVQDWHIGDKVRARITEITPNSILVDLGGKSEGVVDRSLFTDKEKRLTVRVGDEVELFCVGLEDGEPILSTRLGQEDTDGSELRDAWSQQIPVEGKVTAVHKAGLEVTVGRVRGFCPISHVDIHHVQDLHPFLGQVLTFMIMEYSGKNLVLSRRLYLQREREQQRQWIQENLKEGETVSGIVSKIMNFGVFVDLGGVDGLIPLSELSWERVKDPSSVVKEGDRVQVRILHLNWEQGRITLSLKQAGTDPLDVFLEGIQPSSRLKGVVTKIVDYGVFVQLSPGVEGLLHVSRIQDPSKKRRLQECFQEGQSLEVEIEKVEREQRRITLCLPKTEEATLDLPIPGQKVRVKVVEHAPFGIFAQLPGGRKGLLPSKKLRELFPEQNKETWFKKYPLGTELDAVVEEISDGKIRLTLWKDTQEEDEIRSLLQEEKQRGKDFGNLGQLFDGLK